MLYPPAAHRGEFVLANGLAAQAGDKQGEADEYMVGHCIKPPATPDFTPIEDTTALLSPWLKLSARDRAPSTPDALDRGAIQRHQNLIIALAVRRRRGKILLRAVSDESQISRENFLNPATLRPKLITVSVYIAAFELLKSAIVDRIKDFYTSGSARFDTEYQSEVLSKHRSPVYASLEWLKEMQAIDDTDVAIYERFKKLRNELAHALTGMLLRELPTDLVERFNEMVSLLEKIERWWIVTHG